MTTLFSLAEIRAIAADRPPGPEGDEVLDELLDVIAADFAEMWPNAPEGVAFSFAAAQLSMALRMGSPGDDDRGGSRGPIAPAPEPEPRVMPA